MTYCCNECRNKNCEVNYKNAKKGEIIRDVKAYCGTEKCKGYIRP